MLSTSKWLLSSVVVLLAAACATGVEDEPQAGVIGNDGGVNDPSDGGEDDPDAATGDGGGGTGCPAGTVKIPAGADTYCIDATEVTNEAYGKFLAASPNVGGQPAFCAWNDSFQPAAWPPASGEGKHPVTEVDWCDARAYCAWAGKRLCGRIGEGKLPFADHADPKRSEWFNACSNEGTREYPYGASHDGQACNGIDRNANGTVEVGSLESCEGGASGLYDMSGNVLEWEDSCDSETGDKDLCHVRGGSYGDNRDTLKCRYSQPVSRATKLPRIGFRCCR